MIVGCAVSLSTLEDDETDVDGIRLEDEDLLGDPPNDVVVVSSITSQARAPSDNSNDSIKLNNKKMKTRKINIDTTQSPGKAGFFALPFNVMNEVFEHLHPLDLLRLARTSKKLRSQLMSKRFMNVWKKAREAVRPMIPECPKDQSEPQWAALLFSWECLICGTAKATNINWNLRLRGCRPCLETNLISSETAYQAYPNMDNLGDVLRLIPHTARLSHDIPTKKYGMIQYTARRSMPRLYYSAHIKKMVEIWTGYQLRIEYGIPGAHHEFVQYKERRELEVEDQLGSTEELKALTEEMEGHLIEERAKAIIAKLVELDHDPRDARNAVTRGVYKDLKVFEIRAAINWEHAKPVLSQMVAEERLSRIRLEREPLLEGRKGTAISKYAIFKETYDASPDNFLPDDNVFLTVPMIKAIIESDGDDVSPTMFDAAFDKLAEYLDEWRRERRVDLARELILAQESPDGANRDPAVAENEGILLLAASTFACCTLLGTSRNSLHWFETVGEHLKGHSNLKCLGSPRFQGLKCVRVIPEWFAHVRSLVRATGLNPNTATPKDMDQLDARFYCKDCSSKKWGGRLARSWRNCVLHLGFHGGVSVKLKGYEILSMQARAAIRPRESAISAMQAIDWNQVAVTLQGVAVDLRGSQLEINVSPPPPRAIAGNPKPIRSTSKAAASNSKAFTGKDPTAGSRDMTLKSLRLS
ncbi:hypothetical protein FS837_000176 [Tulasnella sp. UAMH 9824]|nr:hypothetical protein FS837_000176 [Tulasnella sp. UAMH 9824]